MTIVAFKKAIQKATSPLPGSIPKPIVYRLSVKQKFNGLTIIEFYSQAIPSIAKEQWIEKVETGNMKVNDQTVSLAYKVKTGDKTQHSTKPIAEPHVNSAIQLIYEDEEILVLNKPAPLPMHPCGRFSKNSLVEILQSAFPTSAYKIIHRIDSNTTGLVVLAKSKGTAQFIAEQFEQQTVQKNYLALVEGVMQKDKFTSTQTIGKEKTKSGGRKTNDTGDKAVTEFEVLEKRTEKALLKVIPHSGRTNQIRLHLADIGHPIIGDHGYKDPAYFEKNPLTYEEDCLCLHAWKLTFIHPRTKKEISFEAPIPEKFNRQE
jgi:RluA family pseudouridine synthase